MRVSRLENDLDSGESWRKQSDGTLVTLSVQESSAEAESDVRRRIFSMQVNCDVFIEAVEGGEVFYLGESGGGDVLQCHVDVVDDVEGDAMK